MNQSLFRIMWEYEADHFGLRKFDLMGNPLICTELSAFNRFICIDIEGQTGDLARADAEVDLLSVELLRQFCRHLYHRLDLRTRDVSLCVYALHDFLVKMWESMGLPYAAVQAMLECLSINLNELRRLRLLHRHLSLSTKVQQEQQGPPDPLGVLVEDNDGQMKLFTPEYPVIDEQVNDVWRVVSKHVKASRVLLRGETSQREISLNIGKSVMNHLRRGDALPLIIAEAWDGQRFITSAGMPPF